MAALSEQKTKPSTSSPIPIVKLMPLVRAGPPATPIPTPLVIRSVITSSSSIGPGERSEGINATLLIVAHPRYSHASASTSMSSSTTCSPTKRRQLIPSPPAPSTSSRQLLLGNCSCVALPPPSLESCIALPSAIHGGRKHSRNTGVTVHSKTSLTLS